MSKHTKRLAVSAVAAALGVVLLFLAAALPVGKLACVCVAGVLAAAVRMTCGPYWGAGCFIVTALLSLFLVPLKSVVVLYAAFLGYYPIIKSTLERPASALRRWLLKLLIFNAAFAAVLALASKILTDALPDGQWPVLLLLLGGNAFFVVYDIVLTRVVLFFLRHLAGKIK